MAISDRVKGTILVARMKYLTAQGKTATEAVLQRLPGDDRDLLTSILLLPSSWYPAELLLRLDGAIAASLAQGDRAAVFLDIGQFSADNALGPKGVLRAYLRENDPHALLREVPRIHASQHGIGKRRYEKLGENTAVLRTIEGDGLEGDDCLTTVGWLRRAIELSGGRDVKVMKLSCLGKGAPCCTYQCDWR
jgi:hypothetical protein